METTIRVRTVAGIAGAVVAGMLATLAVMTAWPVGAAPGDADSTFVPTAGCRLVDTRPAPNNVGGRAEPLGAGDVFELPVHGSNGNCTGALAVPTDAVAVALNVTAVRATATSNIRLYPANLTEVPLLSNLNVTAGAAPTPNKVDVKLSPDGAIKVFNFAGSVDIVADVVGYYTNSTLQELSQRLAALEADVATNTADVATNTAAIATNTASIAALDDAQPFAVTSRDDVESVGLEDEVVVSVDVTAPVDGQVTVNSTTNPEEPSASDVVSCSITTGTDRDFDYEQFWESPGSPGLRSQMAGTRTFDITAHTTGTYNLVCTSAKPFTSATLRDSVLTAIFTPAA